MIFLEHRGTRIATFDVIESDQPWLHCKFIPSTEFDGHEQFFRELQREYQSREIENFDRHFSKLTERGYRLVSGSKKSVRFTLLFEDRQVRMRAHFVQDT